MKLTDHIKQLKDFYKAHGELDVVVGDVPIKGLELGAGVCIVVVENAGARESVFDEREKYYPPTAVPDPAEIRSTRKFSKRE